LVSLMVSSLQGSGSKRLPFSLHRSSHKKKLQAQVLLHFVMMINHLTTIFKCTGYTKYRISTAKNIITQFRGYLVQQNFFERPE
jgi:hypothetical protein